MNLLVSDFDGTYHTGIKDIKLNNIKIQEFIKEGNIFMLSSGRSYNSLKNQVEAYGIPVSYLATADGSHLFNKNGVLIHEELMKKDIKKDIDKILKLNRHKGIQYDTTREYYKIDLGYNVSSINLVIDEDKINKDFRHEWKKLCKKYKDDYNFLVYGYDHTYFYCIKEKGIDKATPVEKLSKILTIPKENIFTIGDGDNDVTMVANYNGYMIGDNEALKKCALGCYNNVYEMVEDIQKQKIKRR